MSIYIIDEIMGRGKTTAMINHINNNGADRRYLFIVPYLTEVERIRQNCSDMHFVEPNGDYGKLKDIKNMLAAGKNIVSTHALFSMFDDEALQVIAQTGYTLVMDEVACVISSLGITHHDAQLISQYVTIGEDDILEWTEADYEGRFEDYRDMIMEGNVYRYNSNFWVSIMPSEMFTSFEDVYLMTYMFDHQIQRCYFDMKGLPYTNLYVNGHSHDTYCLGVEPDPMPPINYKDMITVIDNDKLNRIGDERTSLSKAWYIRNANSDKKMGELRRNLYNYFRNHTKTPSEQNLWTVFCEDEDLDIDWPKMLSGKGYKKGFLACNARGTNEFRDRTAVAYMINCFPNTAIRNFLARNGVKLDQDYYSLSEMIQWIWRSAIRDGKPITVYVPSKRMRTLFQNWLEEVSTGA